MSFLYLGKPHPVVGGGGVGEGVGDGGGDGGFDGGGEGGFDGGGEGVVLPYKHDVIVKNRKSARIYLQ